MEIAKMEKFLNSMDKVEYKPADLN